MNDILPVSVSEGEVVVDNDHLLEAGYIGKPPRFSIGVGRWVLIGRLRYTQIIGFDFIVALPQPTCIPFSKKRNRTAL
ncbi:MAG: hypothetical protein AABN95_03310 [Acidobacteriota bacterium]